ncbi:MAG: hypothetical protein WDO13_00380 [Verrucomicrobiota bacterium]
MRCTSRACTRRPWHDGRDAGVFLNIDPRNAGNLTALNFQAIGILENEIDHFSAFGRNVRADQQDMFDKVCGSRVFRHELMEGVSISHIVRSWDSGVVRWAEERQPYLLYGMTPAHAQKKPSVIAETE